MNHLLSTNYDPETATPKDFNELERDLSHDVHRAGVLVERMNEETQFWCMGFRGVMEDLKKHLELMIKKSERLEDISGGLMRQGLNTPFEGYGVVRCPTCGQAPGKEAVNG